jgi:hypothetical protein
MLSLALQCAFAGLVVGYAVYEVMKVWRARPPVVYDSVSKSWRAQRGLGTGRGAH